MYVLLFIKGLWNISYCKNNLVRYCYKCKLLLDLVKNVMELEIYLGIFETGWYLKFHEYPFNTSSVVPSQQTEKYKNMKKLGSYFQILKAQYRCVLLALLLVCGAVLDF
jgi:hypothetical protein